MEQSEFKAQIFKPKSGISLRLNSTRLIYGSLAIIILFAIWGDNLNLNFEEEQIVIWSLVALMIIGSRWGYHEKQRKHGDIDGTLNINIDNITADDKCFNWKDISNFQVSIGHVMDEPLYDQVFSHYRLYGGPAYSAGVNNFVSFNYNNEECKIFFRLDTPSHNAELKAMIRQLFFSGNIELQTTYNGLQLEYEQIQELKRQKQELAKESP